MEDETTKSSIFAELGKAITIIASTIGGYAIGNKFFPDNRSASGIGAGIMGGLALITMRFLQEKPSLPKTDERSATTKATGAVAILAASRAGERAAKEVSQNPLVGTAGHVIGGELALRELQRRQSNEAEEKNFNSHYPMR